MCSSDKTAQVISAQVAHCKTKYFNKMPSEIFCWLYAKLRTICGNIQHWFPIYFDTHILIQFNDSINLRCTQCLIQYSMNHLKGYGQKCPNWHFLFLFFFFHLSSKVADFLHVTQHCREIKCLIFVLAGLLLIS